MTMPAIQGARTKTPKADLNLADLRYRINLTQELIRAGDKIMGESQMLIAQSERLRRRAEQICQVVQVRNRSIAGKCFPSSHQDDDSRSRDPLDQMPMLREPLNPSLPFLVNDVGGRGAGKGANQSILFGG